MFKLDFLESGNDLILSRIGIQESVPRNQKYGREARDSKPGFEIYYSKYSCIIQYTVLFELLINGPEYFKRFRYYSI